MDFIKYNIEEIIMIAVALAVVCLLFYILKSKKRRRKVGFYINFVMFKLGLVKRMSKTYIGMVHVTESYEPLVELKPHHKIIINETAEQPVMLRKSVMNRLYDVADRLDDGVYIKIYSAYRSRIRLNEIWQEEISKAEKDNPGMNRAELLAMVKYKVAAPNINMGGHDTGAAIDLSLCDKNGSDWDFGSRYHEKTGSVSLSNEQKKNIKYLNRLMRSQGFVQQPSQWWHYSYGDRYWAVYKGRRRGAVYGSAEKEFENTGYVRVVKTISSKANIK